MSWWAWLVALYALGGAAIVWHELRLHGKWHGYRERSSWLELAFLFVVGPAGVVLALLWAAARRLRGAR